MAYRASTGDLGRGERWDRDRFQYERDRDRDRFADDRSRYDDDDRSYSRDSREPRNLPARLRELSIDDRRDRRPPPGRSYDDDYVVRDRRHYDDEPRYGRDDRSSPTTSEFDRRVVIEQERRRSPSPRRRPNTLLRRQSSLDTFDRKPAPKYWEQPQPERYGPPARREDYRPPTNVPIPLPRSRALPPPRRYAERDSFEEIRVSDPDYYGDEEFRPYPERVREKEVIRTSHRRSHSRDSHRSHRSHKSRGRSHHGTSVATSTSRSSSTSSSSSSSSGGTTVKSEYPKKGKTRIPARLVSKRALIDLGWPFVEEGNTIVVQKALGQDNIDDLLKLSEDYKRSEMELVGTRSSAGDIIEERRQEIYMTPGPPPALPPPPVAQYQPVPPPQFMPMPTRNPPPPAEYVRDISPARTTYTTSSYPSAVVVDARPHEMSEEIPVGPLALVTADRDRDFVRHHHHHSRSRSRVGKEIVTAERLSNGELIVFEERVEKIEEGRRGPRIEKDKKGRMSISVPKYR